MWSDELSQVSENESAPLVSEEVESAMAAPTEKRSKAKRATTAAVFATVVGAACVLWLSRSSTSSGNTAVISPEDSVGLDSVPSGLYEPNYAGKEGMWCVGLNAVGLDLGATLGRDEGWVLPSHEALRYFYEKGATCFRLPITWERLQTSLGSEEVDAVEGTDGVVDFITNTLGAHVIIDPHNNDQGLKYDGNNANKTDFVALWKAITKKWGDNDKCIFGLFNEPRFGFEDGVEGYFNPDVMDRDGKVIEHWRQWMQAAIDKIRELGSKNLILVPGLHWTGCADWGGNGWWGETLDGHMNAGNSRLAALTDPENRIAYDVHQYMDTRYTGIHEGCRGHDLNFWCKDYDGCTGADQGLEKTIAWAKRYKKKLMMTEIGSWPLSGTEEHCQQKMYAYLQRMHESGVFIGYQAWQFGCEGCDGDQWTKKPLNLDWYRLKEFSDMAKCSPNQENCRDTKCCETWGTTCFEKNTTWATCSESCAPGVHSADPESHRTPWTCKDLGASECSAQHEDCRETLCCTDSSMTCYEKNAWWASCSQTCVVGIHEEDAKEHQSEWSCNTLGTQNQTKGNAGTVIPTTVVTTVAPGGTQQTTSMVQECTEAHQDCRNTLCCKDADMKCYAKDEHWASCRADCEPGIHEADPEKYRTPWDCEELGAGGVDGAMGTPALE